MKSLRQIVPLTENLSDFRKAWKIHWRSEAMKRKNPFAQKKFRYPLYGGLTALHGMIGAKTATDFATGNWKSGVVGLGVGALAAGGAAGLFKGHYPGVLRHYRKLKQLKK